MQPERVVDWWWPRRHTAATYLAATDARVDDRCRGQSRTLDSEEPQLPGFSVGISGPDCCEIRGAERTLRTCVASRRRSSARASCGCVPDLTQQREHVARGVILATRSRCVADIAGIEQAIDSGVIRVCAICDAYEALDERIAVLGRDLEAIGHARFLRTFSRDVTLLLTATAADASPASVDDDSGIKILTGVVSIGCRDRECIATTANGEEHVFDTLYPVLGSDAQSEWRRPWGPKSDDKGELIVVSRRVTSVPGLYAVGDVVLHSIRSASVGHAAIAATACIGACAQLA